MNKILRLFFFILYICLFLKVLINCEIFNKIKNNKKSYKTTIYVNSNTKPLVNNIDYYKYLYKKTILEIEELQKIINEIKQTDENIKQIDELLILLFHAKASINEYEYKILCFQKHNIFNNNDRKKIVEYLNNRIVNLYKEYNLKTKYIKFYNLEDLNKLKFSIDNIKILINKYNQENKID